MSSKLPSRVRLSPRQWLLLMSAWWSLWKWDRLLRTRNYSEWRDATANLFAPQQPVDPVLTQNWHDVADLVRISEIAARNHLIVVNCLRRCLSQQELLARRGFFSRLHVGVRRTHQSIEAHCWLSWQGKIINDSLDNVALYQELTDVA